MDKYNFIFDKSVGYDEKIREYKIKQVKEIKFRQDQVNDSGN